MAVGTKIKVRPQNNQYVLGDETDPMPHKPKRYTAEERKAQVLALFIPGVSWTARNVGKSLKLRASTVLEYLNALVEDGKLDVRRRDYNTYWLPRREQDYKICEYCSRKVYLPVQKVPHECIPMLQKRVEVLTGELAERKEEIQQANFDLAEAVKLNEHCGSTITLLRDQVKTLNQRVAALDADLESIEGTDPDKIDHYAESIRLMTRVMGAAKYGFVDGLPVAVVVDMAKVHADLHNTEIYERIMQEPFLPPDGGTV